MIPEGLMEQLLWFFSVVFNPNHVPKSLYNSTGKNNPQLNTLGTKLNVSYKVRLACNKKKGKLWNTRVDGRFHPTFLYYTYKFLFFLPLKVIQLQRGRDPYLWNLLSINCYKNPDTKSPEKQTPAEFTLFWIHFKFQLSLILERKIFYYISLYGHF